MTPNAPANPVELVEIGIDRGEEEKQAHDGQDQRAREVACGAEERDQPAWPAVEVEACLELRAQPGDAGADRACHDGEACAKNKPASRRLAEQPRRPVAHHRVTAVAGVPKNHRDRDGREGDVEDGRSTVDDAAPQTAQIVAAHVRVQDRLRGAPTREAQQADGNEKQKKLSERLGQQRPQGVLGIEGTTRSDRRECREVAQNEEDHAARRIAGPCKPFDGGMTLHFARARRRAGGWRQRDRP